MLQIHLYHSNSSNPSPFPQLYPRVTDSPYIPLSSSPDSQPLPTHTQAPHSPYHLRYLTPKDYHAPKPTICFPP